MLDWHIGTRAIRTKKAQLAIRADDPKGSYLGFDLATSHLVVHATYFTARTHCGRLWVVVIAYHLGTGMHSGAQRIGQAILQGICLLRICGGSRKGLDSPNG